MKTISTVMNTDMDKELNINGKIYRLVEEEKPALEVGNWAYDTEFGGSFLKLKNGWCGFNPSKWNSDISNVDESILSPYENMKEVEKLLMCEAERIGFKEGVCVKSVCLNGLPPLRLLDGCFAIDTMGLYWVSGIDGFMLFNFKTGKWAEVIKEPLYTNEYKTKLSDGDEFCWVHNDSLKVVCNDLFDKNCKIDYSCIFMGTERECYRWIDENWLDLRPLSE